MLFFISDMTLACKQITTTTTNTPG